MNLHKFLPQKVLTCIWDLNREQTSLKTSSLEAPLSQLHNNARLSIYILRKKSDLTDTDINVLRSVFYDSSCCVGGMRFACTRMHVNYFRNVCFSYNW